jgi:hypothetical protein
MRIVVFTLCAVLTASQAWAGGSVPEPATTGLLALGIGAVALIRFRRRK